MGICRLFLESIDIYQSLHNLCHLVSSLEAQKSKVPNSGPVLEQLLLQKRIIVIKTNGPLARFGAIYYRTLIWLKLCIFSHE